MKKIKRLSGKEKKQPASRKVVISRLQLRRRREISQQLLVGKVAAEIDLLKTKRDFEIWQS